MGLLPTDPKAIELWHNPLAAEVFLFWRRKIKEEQLEQLSRKLGLLWTREELFKPSVRPDDDVDKVEIPLSTLLLPGLENQLRAYMKKRGSGNNHEVELGRIMTKDEFLEFYRRVAPNLKA